ncbi:MAG: hypothetical protein Q4F18_12520, partial [Clostridia bacterium]|nr:hypothetical protein [Clostridia bacterium]
EKPGSEHRNTLECEVLRKWKRPLAAILAYRKLREKPGAFALIGRFAVVFGSGSGHWPLFMP